MAGKRGDPYALAKGGNSFRFGGEILAVSIPKKLLGLPLLSAPQSLAGGEASA